MGRRKDKAREILIFQLLSTWWRRARKQRTQQLLRRGYIFFKGAKMAEEGRITIENITLNTISNEFFESI